MNNIPESRFNAEDKLQLEVEKLKEEIRNLKKPFFATPTFWFAIVTAIISLASFLLQAPAYKFASEKLKRENAELEIKNNNLKTNNLKLEKDNAVANKTNATLIEASSSVIESAGSDGQNITPELRSNIQNLQKTLKQEKVNFEKTTSKNTEAAKKFEKEGFKQLANGNYDEALVSFTKSENADNGYHASYDIAKIIMDNKTNLQHDDKTRKVVMQKIVENYEGYIPKENLTQIKEQARD